MRNADIVIKYGGHALENAALNAKFCENLVELEKNQILITIVHGGGPDINRLLKAQAVESSFVNGLRVTDAPTLEVVEMALCGLVNKRIVRLLRKYGINACGISGEDGGLFTAKQKNAALGRVGNDVKVNDKLLVSLQENSFTPVIAPLALDAAGEPLNLNADTAAAAVAAAMRCRFVLITDVPGVLDGDGKLVSSLSAAEAEEMKKAGIISGGMIPKVDACLSALANGATDALILDGSKPGSLKKHILEKQSCGTRFYLK